MMEMPPHGFGTFNNFQDPSAVEIAVSEALKVSSCNSKSEQSTA